MLFDDGFTLVTTRRKGRKPLKKPFYDLDLKTQGEENIEINPVAVLRKLEDSKSLLCSSEFLEGLLSILHAKFNLVDSKSALDVVCYGLGHFTQCIIAQYQLALLVILQEKFNATVYIHDPVFYACEVNILRDLNFSIIQENEEGKRSISLQKKTLLYCPHCPKQLINNFLWKNWGCKLGKCIILGNSFADIVEKHILSDMPSISFIQKIQPYTDEQALVNNFIYSDIFNNTSIHMFPEDTLGSLETTFWTKNWEEPFYAENDTEFVRNQK